MDTSPHQRQNQIILSKLGEDISLARRKRRMTQLSAAERAQVSQATIQRLERGEGGVAIGNVLSVLAIFGLQNRLADLADGAHDIIGLATVHSALPSRGSNKAPGRIRVALKSKKASERGAI
jgi:transcriptional regulator with XRE-family HTH domain